MADDDYAIQFTTPLLQTYLRSVGPRRIITRAKAAQRVDGPGSTPRAVEPVDIVTESPVPTRPAARTETTDRLTPATAALMSQLHAVEGELMVRAMIEAAKADGKVDPEERRRILIGLKDADASEADRKALLAAIDQPPNVDALVARVTSPELAVEVYGASLLAIKDDSPREQRYLATLAQRLKLPPATVVELHARYGAPPPLRGA